MDLGLLVGCSYWSRLNSTVASDERAREDRDYLIFLFTITGAFDRGFIIGFLGML